MAGSDGAWTFLSTAVCILVFCLVTASVQIVALAAFESWWGDDAGPVPKDAIDFIKWVVGAGLGAIAGYFAGKAV